MDPFAVLGLDATMDLDPAELERRWLGLSRECHPDRNRELGAAAQLAMLERSAQVNAAYRTLRDPWERARALLELRDPGILERTKRLDVAFLGEAMDLSEEAANAHGPAVPPLRTRLAAAVDNRLELLHACLRAQQWERAAVLLHQSRYYRKALRDLEVKA